MHRDDAPGGEPPASSADPEPIVKYVRLGGSLSSILAEDSASCLGAHSKFLALGTVTGAVHVLDLVGNEIRRFAPHSAPVSDICIDATGEFIGSCSMDGTVVVSSLFGADASTHWYHRPVRTIALDPEYAARRVFASGGLACDLVINSRGWFGSKDSVIHSGEGPVQTIRMAGPMLAWANDLGVKVYDAQHAKRVSYIERPPGAPPPELFRCHLRWQTPSELIIGWADTIKIGRVREREAPRTDPMTRHDMGGVHAIGGSGAANMHLACSGSTTTGAAAGGVYMEIVSLIQLDFYICGLAGVQLRLGSNGLAQSDLLVLAHVCDPEHENKFGPGGAPPGGAQRPEMRLITRQNDEIFADALSLDGFADLRAEQYSLVVPPATRGGAAGHGSGGSSAGAGDAAASAAGGVRARGASADASTATGALSEIGGRASSGAAAARSSADGASSASLLPDFTAYIVSPKDIIVARSRDMDDRISWLVEHEKLAEALELATRHAGVLRAQRPVDIAELHIGALLQANEPAAAAAVCVAHLGDAPELWTRWLHAFCASGHLRHLAEHVPTAEPQLSAEAYEFALSASLVTAANGERDPGAEFISLLRRWPPTLYRSSIVQRNVLEAARRLTGGLLEHPRLLEAMALLHVAASQHEAALGMLLRVPPHESDIFAFIEMHSLHALCRDKLLGLARHSWPKTLALTLRYHEAIPPVDVISQLAKDADEPRLLHYLHELFLRDVHLGAAFHGQQLRLYGQHSPHQLMAFLRGSPHYPLDLALEVCRQHKLVEEQVYVLGRMGAHREALKLMLYELHDIKGALEFVARDAREQPELWQTLLTHAMSSPELVAALLEHVAAEPLVTLDTLSVVQQLPDGIEVPDLPMRLAALLRQSTSQLELTRAAVAVTEADVAALVRERQAAVSRGRVMEYSSGGDEL